MPLVSNPTNQSIYLLQRLLENSPSTTSATLVFIDTPSNDFNSLASTITAHCTSLAQRNNGKLTINPLMAPKSHFQNVLPDAFVDAGYCFTALHWLQHTRPDKGVEYSKPAAAHADLLAFLSARHRELRPDGTLALCVPGQGEVGVDVVLKCVSATAREFSSGTGTYSNSISPSIVARMPLYFRTMDEILAAVSASSKEQGGGAWEVLGSAAVPTPHPACLDLKAERLDGSLTTGVDRSEEYASAVAGFAMAGLGGFLVADARENMRGGYPGDKVFLEDFTAAYEREFLRSFGGEEVGFTYLYLELGRV
jgi:hypothetical protein